MNHESLNRLNAISMNDAIDVVVVLEEAKEGEHKKQQYVVNKFLNELIAKNVL